MDRGSQIIADAGLGERSRKSRWPAQLDVMQSLSGLALSMWGHMFFVSSILISKDAMWTITKMFEVHLYTMVMHADRIGPYESSDRVGSSER